jgi:hypothetical protein
VFLIFWSRNIYLFSVVEVGGGPKEGNGGGSEVR